MLFFYLNAYKKAIEKAKLRTFLNYSLFSFQTISTVLNELVIIESLTHSHSIDSNGPGNQFVRCCKIDLIELNGVVKKQVRSTFEWWINVSEKRSRDTDRSIESWYGDVHSAINSLEFIIESDRYCAMNLNSNALIRMVQWQSKIHHRHSFIYLVRSFIVNSIAMRRHIKKEKITNSISKFKFCWFAFPRLARRWTRRLQEAIGSTWYDV